MPTEVVGKYKDSLKDKYVGESKKQLRHGRYTHIDHSVIVVVHINYTAECNDRSRHVIINRGFHVVSFGSSH